jgi:hypothetical protein
VGRVQSDRCFPTEPGWCTLDLDEEIGDVVIRTASIRDIRADGPTAVLVGASRAARVAAATGLADHLQLDLYRVDLAAVASQYIGETEKNLDRLLGRIGELDAIVFFDECDAIFGKRTSITSRDDGATRQRRTVIDRLEDHGGLVVLGVTGASVVDESVFRRPPIIVEVHPHSEVWRPSIEGTPPMRTVPLRSAAIGAVATAVLASAAAVAISRRWKPTS